MAPTNIHTASVGRWVAVVKDHGEDTPDIVGRYSVTRHCNGVGFFSDEIEAIKHADKWVKAKHLEDLANEWNPRA